MTVQLTIAFDFLTLVQPPKNVCNPLWLCGLLHLFVSINCLNPPMFRIAECETSTKRNVLAIPVA